MAYEYRAIIDDWKYWMSELSVDRIDQLIEIMEWVSESPENFDINAWSTDEEGHAPSMQKLVNHTCGTSACIGGWLSIHEFMRKAGGSRDRTSGSPRFNLTAKRFEKDGLAKQWIERYGWFDHDDNVEMVTLVDYDAVSFFLRGTPGNPIAEMFCAPSSSLYETIPKVKPKDVLVRLRYLRKRTIQEQNEALAS